MSPEQAADDAALRWLLGRGLLQPAGADALRRAAVHPGSPGLLALAAPRLRPEDAAELARVRAGALERARSGRADPSDSDLTLRLAPGSAAGLTPEDPTLRLQAPPASGVGLGADDATLNVPPPAQPWSSGSQAALARTLAAGPPTHPGRLTNSLDLSRDGGLRRIGPYEVVRELARGGMGAVLVARRPGLDRQVALKVMLSGDAAGAEETERFLTEARVAARLKHPNIVGILDVGTDGSRPYLVMDLIEGQSLKAKLERGPLDPREAAELCRDVARALAYAHGQAVLHRDIKPHNILVTKDGAPVVTDFGLAKDVGEGVAKGQTKTGQVMGTPAYMPPEQAEGHSELVDRRADVYSLGATLYEALVGEAPFQGATPLNIITQVLSKDPVPPRRRRPDVDRDLDTIVLRCLEKEPERRYPTAAALADDLDRWLADEPILARPATLLDRARKWGRRNRAAATVGAVALLVLALSGLGGALAFVDARATARARAQEEAREAARLAEERARLAERERVSSEARARYEEVAVIASRVAAELDGEAPVAQRQDLPLERRLRLLDEPIGEAMGLLAAAQRWRAVATKSDVAHAEGCAIAAALWLARLAAEGEQWALAGRALREAGELREGAEDDAREEVDATRERRAGLGERTAQELFARAARGELSESEIGDAGLAISRLPGERTTARVVRELDELTATLAATTRRVLLEAVGADARGKVEAALDAWLGPAGAERVEARPFSELSAEERRALGYARERVVERASARGQESTVSSSGDLETAANAVLADRQYAALGNGGALRVRIACAALAGLEDPAGALALDRYLRTEYSADRLLVALEAFLRRVPPAEVPGRLARDLAARAPRIESFLSGAIEKSLSAARIPKDALDAAAAEHFGRAPGATGGAAGPEGDLPASARAILAGEVLDPARLREAVQELGPRIARAPTVPLLWARSLALERLGDVAGALADADRMVQLDSRNYRGWLRRANLRYPMLEVEGALSDLEQALRIQPGLGIAWQLRARILLLDVGDFTRAAEAASRAIKVREDLGEAWAIRGYARVRAGETALGMQDLERARRVDPDEIQVWRLGGSARHLQGDLAGAEADFSRAIDLARRTQNAERWSEVWLLRAEVRLDRERPREALEDLDALTDRARRHPKALQLRGHALASLGDRERARAAFDELVAALPRDPMAFVLRAQFRRSEEDLPGTLEDLERALALDADQVQALSMKANVLEAMGRRPEALALLDRAVTLAPRDPGMWMARANLRELDGKLEPALEDLGVALELEPRSASLLLRRGALLIKMERLEAASADLERSLEVEPNSANALFVRMKLRLAQGRPVDAVDDVAALSAWAPDLGRRGAEQLRAWLEAHPDHPRVAAARARLSERGVR